MIRASSLYRVCTDRLVDNTEDLNFAKEALKIKVEEKGDKVFSIDDIEEYKSTRGLVTLVKSYLSEKEKQIKFVEDVLPKGAKTYMKELWLETNVGLSPTPSIKDALPLRKGKLMEDEAIQLLSLHYNSPFVKNTERVSKGFLTGEADIVYFTDWEKVIRDNKTPVSWESFRSKVGIPPEYYYQLIGYCYLYDAKEAYLDYTLMPTPTELWDDIEESLKVNIVQAHEKINKAILNMTPSQRIKTFKLTANIPEEIEFIKSRIDKCEEYYNTLNYELCMNIFDETVN